MRVWKAIPAPLKIAYFRAICRRKWYLKKGIKGVKISG
jgi:hypothetical protein